jgi:aspartate/methionine/tyrosine aminotransferase
MEINKSGADFSSIVSIGLDIKKMKNETGLDYLELNRGINNVTKINLDWVDLNYRDISIQHYAPNDGVLSLKKAIDNEYFYGDDELDKISITPGGMSSLDLVFQTLEFETIWLPKFHWGSYRKIAQIRNKKIRWYNSLSNLNNLSNRDVVIICDPNNPTGIMVGNDILLEEISRLKNVTIILDCPYQKLFVDDLFKNVCLFDNVIICESFSKWVGLPGFRIGFIYSNNINFNKELKIRLLYSLNSVSTLPQIILGDLISNHYNHINEFREITVSNIKENIDFLNNNLLLSTEIYNGNGYGYEILPSGIFAVINYRQEFLMEHRIGSVSMSKFVTDELSYDYSHLSRICVSVPHDRFVSFMDKII